MESVKGIMKKNIVLILALTVTTVFILTTPLEVQAAVKISATKMTMEVGKTEQLSLVGTTKKVTYSSSKKSVATVSKRGKITAKKAGTAIISAKYGKKKKTCKVTVVNPLKKPTISRSDITTLSGQGIVRVRVKNPNKVPISATVELRYIDPNYVMVVSSKTQSIPIIEPGKRVFVVFSAKLNKGSVANVGINKVGAAPDNIVSKQAEIKIQMISNGSDGAKLKFVNTSDMDFSYAETLILFTSFNNILAGCSKLSVENLKAGEEREVFVQRPSSVPSNAEYKILFIRNYAYDKK